MDTGRTERPFVVLSGGSGVRQFGAALARHFSPVVFLVNAYDDGKSTGLIRDYLGSLGPSDPAKLIAMLVQAQKIPALTQLWQTRISVERKELYRLLHNTVTEAALSPTLASEHRQAIDAFLTWVAQEERRQNRLFHFHDLALRNVLLMGCVYLQGSFQGGIDYLVKILDLSAEIVVVSEEIAHLVAVLESGQILKTEAEISTRSPNSAIWRVHITPRLLSFAEITDLEQSNDPEMISRQIAERFPCYIQPAERARTSLLEARGVLYAPGTIFSSIIPTAMLLANELSTIHVPRIFMANLTQECEPLTVPQMVQALYRNVTQRTDHKPISRQQVETVISQVLVEQKYLDLDYQHARPGSPITLAYAELSTLANIQALPLEDTLHPGVHASDKVLAALQHTLNLQEYRRCSSLIQISPNLFDKTQSA
jgi:2-phospho-L-lactate transferase/gluconeogenesis factor (CofD/UPF0052 family)